MGTLNGNAFYFMRNCQTLVHGTSMNCQKQLIAMAEMNCQKQLIAMAGKKQLIDSPPTPFQKKMNHTFKIYQFK